MRYNLLGNTGLRVSALGLGGSALGSVFGAVDQTQGIRIVHRAFEMGVNYVDVAPAYGSTRAETVLGAALHGIPRDRYVLSTKVGQYGSAGIDYSPTRVTHELEQSMQRLGTTYIDIVYCHDIEYTDIDYVITHTIPALRLLQAQGKIGLVGVSGYPLAIFPKVLAATNIDAVIAYCHLMLSNTRLQDLQPLFAAHHVGVVNAAPLGMGLFTPQGPPDWHPATPHIKAVCAEAVAFCAAQGVDIAQLALQYAIAQPGVASTLASASSITEIEKNVLALESSRDEALVAQIQAILAPIRDQSWQIGRPENN
ncbi:MAG: aldo/keto reductase [Chloroflexales bacterium]|nr:aldo/keto reductase [Chloroflexales bacterium]